MTDVGTPPPASGIDSIAVAFARVLRGSGLVAPVDSVITFAEALTHVGCDRRDRVYWAGRTTLLRRAEDIPVFDRAFAVFWEHRTVVDTSVETTTLSLHLDHDDGRDDVGDHDDRDDAGDDPSVSIRFSAVETLRTRDFAEYTDAEMAEAHEWMQRLRVVGARRRSLRLVPSATRTRHHDPRRTVRSSFATSGEQLRRRWRRPADKPRRLILLLDVSGSMEPYARALVRWVHAAVVGHRRVEAFTLGTRLTRITRELGSRDPDAALERATGAVRDWSGGTRLGETLRSFNERWGVRGLARGATVVILSDGWDRGDPDALGEQMQRLGRVAHRVVWVNPLKVSPGYAPLARGMAAALPHVDDFVEGHSLEALEHLARVIDR